MEILISAAIWKYVTYVTTLIKKNSNLIGNIDYYVYNKI